MMERQLIIEKIRKKEAEAQLFEDKLKSARVYIQALKDVLAMLPSNDSDPAPAVQVSGETPNFRAGSALARAREAILTSGKPLHLDDLLKAAGKERTREAKTSLSSSLSAFVRKGEVFTRPAVATFGLIELQHFPEDEPTYLDEPPPGFGGLGRQNGLVLEHGGT